MDNFSKFLEQEIPRLRRYASALHRSDRSRADDLVQDTLVRAIDKQHLWQPGTNLRSWLFTLMHNQHVNDVRRSIARGGLSSAIDELHDNLASVNDTSASLQLRDLERAVGKLMIEQRQIILLIALEGMSYADVAKVVGIPIGTVRSRLSRGRMALRQLMDTGATTPRRVSPERARLPAWPPNPARPSQAPAPDDWKDLLRAPRLRGGCDAPQRPASVSLPAGR